LLFRNLWIALSSIICLCTIASASKASKITLDFDKNFVKICLPKDELDPNYASSRGWQKYFKAVFQGTMLTSEVGFVLRMEDGAKTFPHNQQFGLYPASVEQTTKADCIKIDVVSLDDTSAYQWDNEKEHLRIYLKSSMSDSYFTTGFNYQEAKQAVLIDLQQSLKRKNPTKTESIANFMTNMHSIRSYTTMSDLGFSNEEGNLITAISPTGLTPNESQLNALEIYNTIWNSAHATGQINIGITSTDSPLTLYSDAVSLNRKTLVVNKNSLSIFLGGTPCVYTMSTLCLH